MRALLLALSAVFMLAGAADAQQLTVSFNGGLVTVRANGVPVRTILAEWARQGGTQVVNAEKIAGPAVTLELVDVPESQALEVLLRNVAGYMAAPRRTASGPSRYDRILVMPTTTATAASAQNTAAPTNAGRGGPTAGTQRNVPPRQAQIDASNDDQQGMVDEDVNQPAFQFPQPGQGQNIFQQVGQPTPFGTPITPGAQQPVISFQPAGGTGGVTVNPTPQTAPVMTFPGQTPAMGGYGVVGSPTPGVVQQPQPGQPGMPVQQGQPVFPVRPPGDR